MENSLPQVFENEEFGQIRTLVDDNNDVWFIGKDVAKALKYTNTKKAILDHVDPEDKIMGSRNVTPYIIDSRGRKQYPVWINESGLYSLVFSSKLDKAKKFKHWITSEVIPSLRKNGSYEMKPMTEEEIVGKAFLIQTRRLKEAHEQIALLAPKAEFYDAAMSSESLLSMEEVAKILDMGFGRNNLFEFLRREKILRANNIPYQRFVNAGYFKLIEKTYSTPEKRHVVSTVCYVKQKGLDYIRKLVKDLQEV